MNKIAVIGGRDSVLGFRALGLETCIAENGEQARRPYNYIICRDQFFNPPCMKLLFNVILTHSAKKIKPYLTFIRFFIFFPPVAGEIRS